MVDSYLVSCLFTILILLLVASICVSSFDDKNSAQTGSCRSLSGPMLPASKTATAVPMRYILYIAFDLDADRRLREVKAK